MSRVVSTPFRRAHGISELNNFPRVQNSSGHTPRGGSADFLGAGFTSTRSERSACVAIQRKYWCYRHFADDAAGIEVEVEPARHV
jgi:hypothetical protein